MKHKLPETDAVRAFLVSTGHYFAFDNNDGTYSIEEGEDSDYIVTGGHHITVDRSNGKWLAEEVLGLRPVFEPNRDGLAWKMLSNIQKEKVVDSDGTAKIEADYRSVSLLISDGTRIGGFCGVESVKAFAEDLGLEVKE